MLKAICIASLFVVALYADLPVRICDEDSAPNTQSAYQSVQPAEMFKEGMDALNDALKELLFFSITELHFNLESERSVGRSIARVNVVTTALEEELMMQKELVNASVKIRGDITNTRLEASLLLNEIQLAILAIKSNRME